MGIEYEQRLYVILRSYEPNPNKYNLYFLVIIVIFEYKIVILILVDSL